MTALWHSNFLLGDALGGHSRAVHDVIGVVHEVRALLGSPESSGGSAEARAHHPRDQIGWHVTGILDSAVLPSQDMHLSGGPLVPEVLG